MVGKLNLRISVFCIFSDGLWEENCCHFMQPYRQQSWLALILGGLTSDCSVIENYFSEDSNVSFQSVRNLSGRDHRNDDAAMTLDDGVCCTCRKQLICLKGCFDLGHECYHFYMELNYSFIDQPLLFTFRIFVDIKTTTWEIKLWT